jgi:anti-sigma factor RsiW
MCNHERLLDYLYDELPSAERAAFERHVQECVECRMELAELGGTRLALASWSPPDSELGFKIVRERPSAARQAFWTFRPAWGFAAAALLVLAVAAAISNIEVRYGNDGLLVRTGWNRSPKAEVNGALAGTVTAVGATSTPDDWSSRLRSLDARLQQLEQQNRTVKAAALPGDTPAAGSGRMSDAELLRTMRKIIADSETRQQRELAMRLTQVVRDFDATRTGDLARIEQGLRRVQGLNDAELIQHRETLQHLMRVTQQR